MPVLKLADLKVEDRYAEFSGEQFEGLLGGLGDSKWNWRDETVTRTMIPVSSDLPQGVRYQKNYIEYLTRCWAHHYGVVIEPNHVWYTLLCELAWRVKADPETYRPIFTDSPEKQDVFVPYDGGGFTISLDLLIGELRKVVPTDVDAFFPQFSTNTPRSLTAKYAAFAEMASPYYSYFMYACGFPAIDVQGTLDDWKLMADKWRGWMTAYFAPISDWVDRVQGVLDHCVANYESPEWWKGIYSNERCGSGGEVFVAGWFAELFYEKPELPKPGNFPTCVAAFDYTRVNIHDAANVMNFTMKHGLFSSVERDGFLVPDFGHVLFNVSDGPVTFAPEMRQKGSRRVLVYRLEPEHMVNSAKTYDKLRRS